MTIKEFDEYRLLEHRGQRAYSDHDATFYRIVWRKGTCLRRMRDEMAKPDKGQSFLNKLYDWMNSQEDKLHQEWAQDCVKAMEQAYDEISSAKPKPNLFGGKASA